MGKMKHKNGDTASLELSTSFGSYSLSASSSAQHSDLGCRALRKGSHLLLSAAKSLTLVHLSVVSLVANPPTARCSFRLTHGSFLSKYSKDRDTEI